MKEEKAIREVADFLVLNGFTQDKEDKSKSEITFKYTRTWVDVETITATWVSVKIGDNKKHKTRLDVFEKYKADLFATIKTEIPEELKNISKKEIQVKNHEIAIKNAVETLTNDFSGLSFKNVVMRDEDNKIDVDFILDKDCLAPVTFDTKNNLIKISLFYEEIEFSSEELKSFLNMIKEKLAIKNI